jgi:hypothetical protein
MGQATSAFMVKNGPMPKRELTKEQLTMTYDKLKEVGTIDNHDWPWEHAGKSLWYVHKDVGKPGFQVKYMVLEKPEKHMLMCYLQTGSCDIPQFFTWTKDKPMVHGEADMQRDAHITLGIMGMVKTDSDVDFPWDVKNHLMQVTSNQDHNQIKLWTFEAKNTGHDYSLDLTDDMTKDGNRLVKSLQVAMMAKLVEMQDVLILPGPIMFMPTARLSWHNLDHYGTDGYDSPDEVFESLPKRSRMT